MKFKERSIIFIFLVLSQFFLYSEQLVLKDIEINNLTRTKYSTVLKIIELNKGDIIDDYTIDDVEQKLLSSGIFQKDFLVVVDKVSDTEGVLKIDIYDKWTLIPIPVGFVSSNDWLAGGVFIESNLIGLNQTLVAGTFLNSDYVQGFGSWKNPTFLNSNYSFGASTSFYSGLETHLDIRGDEILATYNENRILFSLNAGRTYSMGLGLEVSSGIEWFTAKDSKGYLKGTDVEELFIKNTLMLKWDNIYYSNFFNKGWSGKIKVSNLASDNYYINPIFESSIYNNITLKERNLLKSRINVGIQNSLDYRPLLIGGTEGSRVLPSGSVAVEKYINGLISFEPVVINPSWGFFTLPVYYEAGIYESLVNQSHIWHGPGVGFRFYVDKVAIPALGADFTWDLQRGLFKVAVSIGGTGGGE